MITINLLPWRLARRQQRQLQFATLFIGGVFITFLILARMDWVLAHKLSDQNKINLQLGQAIAELDKEIKALNKLKEKRALYISSLTLLHELHNNRINTLKLFSQFSALLPEEIYLTQLTKHRNHLIVTGIAVNNSSITQFLKNIIDSNWLSNPSIEEINRENSQHSINTFKLMVKLAPSKEHEHVI